MKYDFDKLTDRSITCVAPTKAFNIAGLQTFALIAFNPVLYHRVWRGLNTDEAAEPNAFAIQAAMGAFTNGGEWLDCNRVTDNSKDLADFIRCNTGCIFH